MCNSHVRNMIRKIKKTRLQLFHYDVNKSPSMMSRSVLLEIVKERPPLLSTVVLTLGIEYPDKSCTKVVNMDECIHNFDIVICSNDLKVAVDFFIFCCVQSNKILYIHNHNLQYIPDKDIFVIGVAHWPSFLKVNSLHRLLILLSLILFVFIFIFLRLLSRKIMSKN